MSHAQAADHQFDGVGELFLEQFHALGGLGVDPDEDAADADADGDRGADRDLRVSADCQADEGEDRHRAHQHDELFRGEGDGRLLRLGGQDGVDRDVARLEVLGHLLAEFLHYLFAAADLVEHFEPGG